MRPDENQIKNTKIQGKNNLFKKKRHPQHKHCGTVVVVVLKGTINISFAFFPFFFVFTFYYRKIFCHTRTLITVNCGCQRFRAAGKRISIRVCGDIKPGRKSV